MSIASSIYQGCPAKKVIGFYISTLLKQHPDYSLMSMASSNAQWCATEIVVALYVSAPLEQKINKFRISNLCSS
ncbi:hypothetical protein BDV39DRAFT_178344 [Aspergillus sergii]|uniref:Uncharacterized protein n=1 Tax=Aspergillus sergii TaxID=1034303 RepID=A0A5N6WXC5_9EURO|nr:hypothetical protein BDV39DRAFT_178344 [Aspergillus sergii]